MLDSSDELPEGVPSSAPLDIPEIETVDRHTQWVDFSLENVTTVKNPHNSRIVSANVTLSLLTKKSLQHS